MKKGIIISLILSALVLGFSTYYNAGKKCTGSKNCKACKTCEYCKYCAKDGGSCGVCK